MLKLSFTTLGCQHWSFDEVLSQAKDMGFAGIELRGIKNEMYLPRIPELLPENLDMTISRIKEKKLEICGLSTSCKFHETEKENEHMKEAIETIDLAERMKVRYIRIQGDKIPNPEKKDEIIKVIANRMAKVCEYAENKGVMCLVEVHGDFNNLENLSDLLKNVNKPNIGILWDIEHSDKVYGDNIEVFYNELKSHIKMLHIKDHYRLGDGKFKPCSIGEGNIPIPKIIRILKNDGFDGFLSLEWEKKWHPHLDDPEVSFPAYVDYMKKLI
jgi:sugar phosphate isomerase/epimerase